VKRLKVMTNVGFKAVPPGRTFDVGFGDDSHAYGGEIRNGRLFEKNSRRNLFFAKHKIVKF
jgi:hypothetical protein